MTRVITYFSKTDESYTGEITIGEFSLNELRKYFTVDDKNPMYDSFQIHSDIDSSFFSQIDFTFDFEKYDYFLDYN